MSWKQSNSVVLQQVVLSCLLVIFAVFCTSCRTPSFPQINPTGAIVLSSSQDVIKLRAYSPEVTLELSWPEDRTTTAPKIILENIAAESTGVKFLTGGTQTSITSELTSISNTVLELKWNDKSSHQKIIFYPTCNLKDFSFAVVGDSQGRNEILSQIITQVNSSEVDFLVHLGDMVPSGQKTEYASFQETVSALDFPLYTVLGNHDIRNGGKQIYSDIFAPPYYYFEYKGYRLIFLDSSSLNVDNEQMTWLRKLLATPQPTYIFLHVPPLDPRGKDHGFLDSDTAKDFLELVCNDSSQVKAVFNGHVHIFDRAEINGVTMVTSGGGGAPLYASTEEGGFLHFLIINAPQTEIAVKKIEASRKVLDLVLSGKEKDVLITSAKLKEMATLKETSSYQNRLGNITGQGTYRGIPVRELLQLVGGMKASDTLVVHSLDGYKQEYAYANIYPEEFQWAEIQGEMILAVEFNDTGPPNWQAGYRIAFMPPDKIYDNKDCAQTSAPGQGWHLYKSAGARWVKNVVLLEVK